MPCSRYCLERRLRGRYRLFLDEAKTPVAIWSPEGEFAGGLREPEELECAAMTFDNDYGVWAHFMPSGKIKRFGKEKLTFGSVYQGFSAFGVSSDRLLMAVSWQRGICENRMYLNRVCATQTWIKRPSGDAQIIH